MALYFETELQGASFLFLCGVGLILAMLFDLISVFVAERLKPLGDVLLFLLCGFVLLLALVFLRANELRLFHWVALLTGAILYLCGIRRFVAYAASWLRSKIKPKAQKKKNIGNQDIMAGKKSQASKP